MKVYKKNQVDFEEVDDEVFEKMLEENKIETVEIEAGKTSEQIFNELKKQGVEVEVHNGVYCKVVYGTFEAINAIPPKVKYVEV